MQKHKTTCNIQEPQQKYRLETVSNTLNKISNWSPYKMQFYEIFCNISEGEMYMYHTSLLSNTIVKMKVFQTKSLKRCGVAILHFLHVEHVKQVDNAKSYLNLIITKFAT